MIKNQIKKSQSQTNLSFVYYWVASERTFKSDTEMLDYAGKLVRALRTSEKLKHRWFGTFSQIDQFKDGTTQAFSNFVVVNQRVIGNVLTGRGTVGTGETVSLQGNVNDGKWKGVVTNETAGVSFESEGVMTDTEFTASYKGYAWGRFLQGTAVLLR